MKGFALVKSIIALLILTRVPNQLSLAQPTDSRGRDTVKLVGRLEGQDSVPLLAFSPDGKTLAAVGHDDKVWLWNVPDKKPVAIIDELFIDTTNLVFSPDGKTLAVASGGQSLRIYEVTNLKKALDLQDRSGGLVWVAFSPDGKRMATGGFRFGPLKSWTGIVALRDPKDGKVQKTVKFEDGPVHWGDFSPDGKTLALATGDRWAGLKMYVTLWSGLAAEELGIGHEAIDWTPHGKLKLLEVPTGKVVKTITAHDDRTELVKFSPGGRLLATAGGGGVVKLWDAATWKEECKLKGHEGVISSLAFSPDGKVLASADDYSVKLWDVANRRELADLSKQLKGGHAAAFAPEGRTLATGVESEDVMDFLSNPLRLNPVRTAPDDHVIRLWKVEFSAAPKKP
jgi:WD40 repeat protein